MILMKTLGTILTGETRTKEQVQAMFVQIQETKLHKLRNSWLDVRRKQHRNDIPRIAVHSRGRDGVKAALCAPPYGQRALTPPLIPRQIIPISGECHQRNTQGRTLERRR